LHTGVYHSIEDHPVDHLLKAGVQVSISADNRTMSNTTTTSELLLLVETFNWGPKELYAIQRNALEVANCSEAAKSQVRDALDEWVSSRD
jgi:adenosine deaminase